MKKAWQKKAEQIKVWKKQGSCLTLTEELLMQAYEDFDNANFWNAFVYPEGANPEEIQNELSDYHAVMDEVSEVYLHITGGQISKQNTRASAVISIADEHYARVYMEDTAETITELHATVQDAFEEIMDTLKEECGDRS